MFNLCFYFIYTLILSYDPFKDYAEYNNFFFHLGKRICLGESLARQELFLIFTRMLQKFQIVPVDGEKLPNSKDASRGIIHSPPKFNVRLIPRHKTS